MVAGSPGSGKTYSIAEILQNMFVDGNQIKKVVFFYASWQDIYDKLEQAGVVTKWIQRMPTNEEVLEEVQPYKRDDGSIVITDDYMSEISKELVKIVSVSSRHNNVSTFLLFQSLFPTDKESRQVSLNIKYIWVFKNLRENAQFGYLVRQIAPWKSAWMVDAYQAATEEPFTYAT